MYTSPLSTPHTLTQTNHNTAPSPYYLPSPNDSVVSSIFFFHSSTLVITNCFHSCVVSFTSRRRNPTLSNSCTNNDDDAKSLQYLFVEKMEKREKRQKRKIKYLSKNFQLRIDEKINIYNFLFYFPLSTLTLHSSYLVFHAPTMY